MSQSIQQKAANVQQFGDYEPYLYENSQQFAQNIQQNHAQNHQKDEFSPLFAEFSQPQQPNIQQNTTRPIGADLLDGNEPIIQAPTQAGGITQPLSQVEQLIVELQQVQNELAKAKTVLGNKSTGLIGTRNNLQTQKNRAAKTLNQAQGVEAQTKAQKTLSRYESQLNDVLPKIAAQNATIKDLEGKERQLQYKLQAIETPFEIKEVYNG